MNFQKFTIGDIGNNNYLIMDNGEAALIDCSGVIPELEAVLKENKCELKYVLLTHGHFDHIQGLKKLQDKYPNVKTYLHADDQETVDTANEFLKMVGLDPIEIPRIDVHIKEGDKIKVGDTELEVIHLPGHTPGGVGYKTGNILFSGDTVFLNSVGRTDLPGGDHNAIIKSVKEKIFTLPDNTIIYPGHGADTSVEYEKRYNNIVTE